MKQRRTCTAGWSDAGYYVYDARGAELAGPFNSPDGADAFARAYRAHGWACLLPRWWRKAYREGRLDERGKVIEGPSKRRKAR